MSVWFYNKILCKNFIQTITKARSAKIQKNKIIKKYPEIFQKKSQSNTDLKDYIA